MFLLEHETYRVEARTDQEKEVHLVNEKPVFLKH